MTATTINRVAALHALAVHIDSHNLASDISGIQFDPGLYAGISVQVHEPETVATWVGSLGPVEAEAKRVGGTIHVWIWTKLSSFPLAVVFVAVPERMPELFAELLGQVAETTGHAPIRLPRALGGTE